MKKDHTLNSQGGQVSPSSLKTLTKRNKSHTTEAAGLNGNAEQEGTYGSRNNTFQEFSPRFMLGLVDLREDNLRHRMGDVEDCTSEHRPIRPKDGM